MGGEGSMMHAIKLLKSNKALLKRIERGTLSGSYGNLELKEFPKAISEQLLEIKERIKRENKQAKVKQLVVFIVFVLSLILLFFYLIH